MLRKFVCTMVTFACCTVFLMAADFTGKVKEIKKGAQKGDPATLVVTVGDKDQEIVLGKGYKLLDASGAELTKKDKGAAMKTLVGKEVVVKTEKKDDKESALEVKIK